MSDDGFFREVNEELRQDQARALWDRYGPAAIVIAVLVVLGTGGFVGYNHWATTQANRSGDSYSEALKLANGDDKNGALAALVELETGSKGAYPVLARLRAATVKADMGDAAGAIASFEAVAKDNSVPVSIRDMAQLRAGLIEVDHGTYDAVSARVGALNTEANPLRHSAREALGLAAWKENRMEEATKLFELISADQTAPRNLRERANLLTELIRGSGSAS
ncbi:tetratricopeptide repeat protein [Mesorhizobium sp. NBSH29]|uniref:tetratricopeptide repeat protein n=1 Tax=Mesorhizobium sp. NBSH29 TaxID=2654249 RepID=UPI0018966772|nr:tetratricopeptide repeat protein [Mesorhizobium sp. NBSH29]QPC86967.1 tetratricopeptide repeat protein [Mesorhizobium sp. NBSH29]